MTLHDGLDRGATLPGSLEDVLRDDFADRIGRGEVVGSRAGGFTRRGVDRESVMSVDHGALRIGTLATSEWGSATLCYGPIDHHVVGRTSCVAVLNGHNTAESYALGSVVRRVGRWARGSETDPLWRRALRYPRSRPRESIARKVRYWWANRGDENPGHLENLMVGWFSTDSPAGPAAASGVVVRATGPHNGELTVTGREGPVALFRGLQNLPAHYVAIRREKGVILHAASAYPHAQGLPAAPWLTPLLIDDRDLPEPAYVGVSQGVSGQIGFSCDTRVHEVRVCDVSAFARWSTSAAFADRLAGSVGAMGERVPEVGNAWRSSGDPLGVDQWGLHLLEGGTGSLRAAIGSLGLLRVVVDEVADDDEVELSWGGDDDPRTGGGCSLLISASALTLVGRSSGAEAWRRATPLWPGEGARAVQLRDDGVEVLVVVDGRAVLSAPHVGGATPDAAETLVVRLSGTGRARVRDLEVHERRIAAPTGLLPAVATVPLGDDPPWFVEDFGTATDDLDDTAAGPAGRWHRRMGPARLEVPTPGTARFDASLDAPVVSRTTYLLDWPDPAHCDIELEGSPPPATAAEEGQRCRVGLALWQDDDTSMVVNIYLDQAYPAASASTFFTFRGFEDIYDAVWSNLGDLVSGDSTFKVRLVSDGERFLVLVNGEPVLHRAFSDVHPATDRLAIRRAGIVANWEWGHDTGSLLHRFVARRRDASTDGAARL